MKRARTTVDRSGGWPALLVGSPSPALDRKHALLAQAGFEVTRAENVCYAELYAESQFFNAAIYDDSLGPEEQVSLARIMRIRWPWIKLVLCGPAPLPTSEPLFDARAYAESELADCVKRTLTS